MVSLAVPGPEHRPAGERPVSRMTVGAGRDRDWCTEGMPERRWRVINLAASCLRRRPLADLRHAPYRRRRPQGRGGPGHRLAEELKARRQD